MSRRIEQSRRHGPWDPRYAVEAAALPHGRVSIVTSRNSNARLEQRGPISKGPKVAFRHELRDGHGSYIGTFVTAIEQWETGDVFTTGDGCELRIASIAAPEHSSEHPSYTDRWNVERAK